MQAARARRAEAPARPHTPTRTRDTLAALTAKIRSVHRLHLLPGEDARESASFRRHLNKESEAANRSTRARTPATKTPRIIRPRAPNMEEYFHRD
jgi:hypothetical protein